MKPNVINPFKIKITDEEILLTIDKIVHNNQWYLFFGTIQETLLHNTNKRIVVDMTNCEYVCPNFLISLYLTLTVSRETIDVDFDIQINKNNYFSYCVEESLIKCNLPDLGLLNSGCTDYESIYPLHIFNISKYDSVNDIVNQIISNFKNLEYVFNSAKEKDIFIIKIKNILFELIDNTNKYAYPSSHNKYAAVYLRFTNPTEKNKEIWRRGNTINDKGLDLDVFMSSKIEIYYQDLGVGIISGYTQKYDVKIDSKRPLREIFKKLFFYNENRFLNRTDNTDICGLQYIGKILEYENNYIVVYNQNECVGAFLSNVERNIHSAFYSNDYSIDANFKGLSYVLFMQTDSSTNAHMNSYDLSGAIESLYRNESMTINVIDQRNTFPIANHFGVLNEKKVNGTVLIDNNLENLFLFTGQITSKHALIWKIKSAMKFCKNTSKLIICDVPDFEMNLIKYSLSNSINIFGEKLTSIHVVSETLTYDEYVLSSNRFVRSDNHDFLLFNSMYNYITSIKFYETYVLLLFQKNNEIGQYSVTRGKIIWDNNITLDGYINFDILITYPKMFEFLKANIKRILPIIGNGKLIALDNMVSRLADELNSERVLDLTTSNNFSVFLGSVYVSGTTYNRNKFNNSITIHYFNRSESEKIPSIFFTPQKFLSSEKSDDKYIRIGKSYKIINEKDLNVHINNNCYLNTKETYDMLNNSLYSPIICNHISFYGKHYILDLNVSNIFDDKSSKLSEFMINFITSSLGHYLGQNEDNQHKTFFDEFNYTCGIVYLSHYYTDKIMSKTMSYCSLYQKFIIGLNHINLFRYEQSLEFSSIYKQYIKDLIQQFRNKHNKKEIKFIVFDTLINSGRTRKEIKLYLQSLGVERVIFVSVIDAQEQRYDKSSNNYCFMALNIPRLGRNSSCPICEANSIFNYFLNEIIDPDLLARIKAIVKKWECKSNIYDYSTLKDKSKINISNKEIQIDNLQYESDEEIVFNRVFPLYLYISGKVRQVNDFLLFEEFLNSSLGKFEVDSSALLLTLFLLEFHEECYVNLREKIIKILLTKMGHISESDISSLCLITLAQSKDQVRNVLLKDNLLMEIKLSHDLELLLIYVLNFSELKANKIEFPKYLENKVKRGGTKKDIYKQFYCQLINTNGDTHDSPLLRLRSNKDDKSYATAASSLSLLKTSLESQVIQFDALFNGDNIDFKKTINQLDVLLQSIGKNGSLSSTELEQLNDIFNVCIKINSGLVYPIGISKKYGNDNIIQKVKRIVNEYNLKYPNARIKFDNNYELPHPKTNAKELFYIFNGMLKKEIEYALNNVYKHCFDENENCLVNKVTYNERGTIETYLGCLHIDIKEEKIIIDIVNNVNKNDNDIVFKVRYEKEELKNLGVEFQKIENDDLYKDFDSNCFIQRIIIPNINEV